MILVTGGAGFIGSHLIEALNKLGHTDILVSDDLTDGTKIHNLSSLEFSDYIDRDDLWDYLQEHKPKFEAIYHLGAISDTTEWNGKLLMKYNYQYTKILANYAISQEIPFSYASSASVYGNSQNSKDLSKTKLEPLNAYAFSKYLFDKWAQKNKLFENPSFYGFRFFNVYGLKNEDHKKDQASPVHKFTQAINNNTDINLFEGSDQIYRDFVYVEDCVQALIKFTQDTCKSGIYDLGTGSPTSFAEIAELLTTDKKSGSQVKSMTFPEKFKGAYQYYTCANLEPTLTACTGLNFRSVKEALS